MKNSTGTRHGKAGIVVFFLFAFAGLAGGGLFATDSHAYDDYTGGCNSSSCHGSFTSSTSPKGTNFGAAGNKHEMHRSSSFMGTACGLCHTTNGDSGSMTTSRGSGTVTGRGCTGCHNAPGLRNHHRITGASTCSCHGSSPEVTPAESTMPPYYGTSATKANNACNLVMTANLNENWSVGDFLGLDNDGNDLYDGADLACAPITPKPMFRIDFEPDGKTDLTIFRPSNSTWYITNSSNGAVTLRQWGSSNDNTVPGDYDGDGKTDFAVWRSGTWFIINSSTGATTIKQWGTSGDVPVKSRY